jgi:serine/threonine protein kinase
VVKLLDFGIARALADDAHPRSASTTMGTLHVFTPEYASPEQFKNEQVDTGSDVYSLGVILYELLTGHPPL